MGAILTGLANAVVETFNFRVEAVLGAIAKSPQVVFTCLGRDDEAPLEHGLPAHTRLTRLDARLCGWEEATDKW